MIDSKQLLKDFEVYSQKLETKGFSKEELIKVQKSILLKNQSIKNVEQLRFEKNRISKIISDYMLKKQISLAEPFKIKLADLKKKLKQEEELLSELEEHSEKLLLNTPNCPDDQAPIGKSSKDNVEILKENFDENYFNSKKFLPHWEIMDELDIFDQKRATKMTGSMFAVLKGSGAKLLRSLLTFGFDLFEKDYLELVVPSFVNSESLKGTGHLPKFSGEAYHIEKDDLWAIPTGEVPLTAFHRSEILEEKNLPLNYMTYTPCFRREAGAAGQENRGLQRLHEFHKLELVKICEPSQSQRELDKLLKDALKPIQLLKLPYRVLDLCTNDLTFSSARTYDIEVYSPGTKTWLEVSSVSLFTDYQSRRCQMRFRSSHQNTQILYPHTLNGSGLATPRVLAALLENGREAQAKVRIPSVLVKYMGSEWL